jgi:hypothetical protein
LNPQGNEGAAGDRILIHHRWVLRSAIALAVLLVGIAGARAQDDFATRGTAWNSVSQLILMARERGMTVETPARLDAGTLRPSDSLLILAPEGAPPSREITAFLRAGGRVLLADDFGAGAHLLETFEIDRHTPTASTALKLRGNPELLVARPHGQHRLTRDVAALVTNHPSVVHHQQLSPIFEVSPNEAVVLAGAVGSGRLVVLSDPSVLIDNMLALRGNRAFAENLIEYLEDDRGGRLFVLGPSAVLAGRYGEPGADRPLHDLRAALERGASLDIPPMALRIGSIALAAIAIILAIGTLPRRSPYRSDRMFARAPAQGGFIGRVLFFARNSSDLLQPLMVYKFELEAEILRRLSLGGKSLLRDVLAGMRKRGMAENDVESMRALLLELDRLRDLQDRPPSAPRVAPARFRELVGTGERLLARITQTEPKR